SPLFSSNATATTEIYTLSLHDALPISLPPARGHQAASGRKFRDRAQARRRHGLGAEPGCGRRRAAAVLLQVFLPGLRLRAAGTGDRKSTRLNSSHVKISYAVFCLKKKK